MYYLTVKKNGAAVVEKQAFADYAAAVASTAQFYGPRAARPVLRFTTEVINGEFARSYATLTKPEDVPKDSPHFKERHHVAVHQANAYSFDGSYFFLIESEAGMRDAEAMRFLFENED